MRKIFVFLFSVFCIQLLLQDVVLAEHYEISGTSTTVNQTFQNHNETENGGVFYVDTDGKLTISSATFINNETNGYGGGAIYNSGIINITDGVIFSSNSAGQFGGAITNLCEIGITGENIEFKTNIAKVGGAICNAQNSKATIFGDVIIFYYNDATSGGGAIYNTANSTTTITGSKKIEFKSNTTAGKGGAICNYDSYQMTINGKEVIFNYNTANTATSEGGAIFNDESSSMEITGEKIEFSFNTAGNKGGVLYNHEKSNITIEGGKIVFNSNTAEFGGAIYNEENSKIKISGEKVEFSSNTVNGNGAAILNNKASSMTIFGNNITFSSNVAYGYGGAIYNNLSLMEINSEGVINFIFNRASSIGGGICNMGSSTMTISGQNIIFSSNSASSGGAIYNDKSSMTMHGNSHENSIVFYSNSATSGVGGAINNFNNATTTIIGENIEFNKNTANYGSGGAIYNYKYSTVIITGEKIEFSYNTAGEYGGAVYNNDNSTMTIIGEDILFSNNKAEMIDDFSGRHLGAGGAIYNGGNSILNLVSSGNMVFTGNKAFFGTANGISNAIYDYGGTINLYASDNAEIIFNDRITSENSNSVLNINQSTTTLNAIGKIVLNEDMSGFKGAVNLYNGEIELKPNVEEDSNINKNKFFSGSITLSGGTLNIQNGVIDDIKVTNLTSTENTNLKFDVDLSNNTSDIFTITNDATGELNLTAINILGVNGTSGQLTLFNDEVAPTLNILTTANYGGYEYTFTNSSDTLGVLNYEQTGTTRTFKEVVNDVVPGYRSYSLAGNETVIEDLGELGGTQLTIFGNGKNIEGNNSVDGIYVADGKILNIENVNSWRGFNRTYGAIKNEGNLYISETNFEDNDSQDIINNGDLWLFGNCYLENGINGTGTTTVSGNITSSGTIQNSIYVYRDSVLKNNGTLIVNGGTNNGTITDETTTNTSSMTIIGNFVNNNKIKQNNVSIENNAILTLTQNSDMDVDNYLITVATIDMANSVLKEHNFNTLRVGNNLNLFVDADLENKQMDTITANEDSDIQGKINVKAINILADATEDRTEILFTNSTVLKDKITTIKTASSGLYKYDINYNDGYLTFIKAGDDQIRTQSQVATAVGGAITQTAVLNQVFTSIDSAIQDRYINYYESSKHKNIKKSNLYASTTNLLYKEPNKIEKGLWIRPYAMQDTIKINNLSVDNSAIGTLAGLDLSIGENSLLSFYIGYAGSTQKYENIKVNQTGYVVGATGMIIKDDYYLGLTANMNFNKAESENNNGTDKFDMNMYALGAKAGYDIYLGEKWIIEPNLTLMYGNINTPEYTTKQGTGAKINSQSTTNILIEPQIKAKLDLTNGWTPYALVGYVLNAGDKTKLVANNIAFDDMQISGYAEYGLGVNKSFKDSLWSCFVQVVGRGGDKNGFEGNIGIKYSL